MKRGVARPIREAKDPSPEITRLRREYEQKCADLIQDKEDADHHCREMEHRLAEEARKYQALQQVLMDENQNSRKIEQARQDWRQSMDAVEDPIMVHDAHFCVTRCNRAYAERAGLQFREIIGKPYWECFPRSTGPLPGCKAETDSIGGTGHMSAAEEEFTLAGGEIFISRAFPMRTESGRLVQSLHIFKDVTARKLEEKRGQQRLQRIRLQTEALATVAASDELFTGDVTGLARLINELVSRVTDVERSNIWLFHEDETELHCVDLYEATPGRHSTGMVLKQEQFQNEFRALKSAPYVNADNALTDPRTTGYVESYLKPLGITSMLDAVVKISGRHLGLLCLEHVGVAHHWERDEIEFACRLADKISVGLVNRDRRAAQDATREVEERHRLLFETSRDAFMTLAEPDWRFLSANPSTLAMFRAKDIDQFLSKTPWELSPDYQPDGRPSREKAREMIAVAMRDGNHFFEWTHKRLDGQEFPATVLLTRLELRGKTYLNGAVRDITERKQAERSLLRVNRALMTLSAGNETLVRATDERTLLGDMCRVIVNTGGHYLALVIYAQKNEEMSAVVMAAHGPETTLLDGVRISWDDDEFGRGPIGMAIRTGTPQLARGLLDDPHLSAWRDLLMQSKSNSILAVPLLMDGACFGALTIASTDAPAFDDAEVKLLTELAGDLAFGVVSLRMRLESAARAEKLRRVMESTVAALVATVESRDPYTAGHQRRVAELAAAIGREMGFDEDRIEGIHFAAAIHDIGKIAVPAEILVRPGRISPIEFEIIKSHPQVGHDIVKGVDFPWPVAQIILQHHEHLDGSGYPQGLKGDQIIPEARIVTVADVVEAMMSHRPYRPAVGIDAALSEITRNRGKTYDADVVDACLRLINEKGFEFSGGNA